MKLGIVKSELWTHQNTMRSVHIIDEESRVYSMMHFTCKFKYFQRRRPFLSGGRSDVPPKI